MNKEGEMSVAQHSHEDSVTLSLHVPLSAHQAQTVPHTGHQLDVPKAPKNKVPSQHACDSISQNKETSSVLSPPESPIALTVPIHPPAHSTQAVSCRQHPDETLLPMETVPRQNSLFVASDKGPSTQGEGTYLARTAAYVQEHLHKRSLDCDTFPPQIHQEPLSRAVKVEARQSIIEVVSNGTTRATESTPCAMIAPALPMPAAMLVSPPPARLLLWLRVELESQHWKPPDEEQGSRQFPYERLRTSVVKHSPLHGTVIMLPVFPLAPSM
ncbi:hypothetical protein AX14_003072 [Amanita brunnescens Koide BX004]|nr:hypothetical protein AX14_003072 [Amanita brunnescens Koide BX004]